MTFRFYKQMSMVIAVFLTITGATASAQVSEVGTHRLHFSIEGNALNIPAYRNYALESDLSSIRRAVFVIHGTNRNAGSYYVSVLISEAFANGTDSTSLIIAPQFLIEDDINTHGLSDSTLFWSSSGWKIGHTSRDTGINPRPVVVSSFAVMDSVILQAVDRAPNLEQIVVVGHSAGGQYVHRYAAGNRLDAALQNDHGISMRYIVTNPSSYLYFNGDRQVDGSPGQFGIPANANSCDEYNEYKYGLEDLNNYMSAVGASQIRTQFPSRNVIYLVGEDDNDPNSSSLDRTCMALLQGNHRLERGLILKDYLAHYFGPEVFERQEFATLPNVGHSSRDVFTSSCGQFYIFDTGVCNTLVSIDNQEDNVLIPHSLYLEQNYPNPFNPTTTIGYQLPKAAYIDLSIFNVLGQQVRTLVNEKQVAGTHRINWDGKDDDGTNLGSGLYYYRIYDGQYTSVVKSMLLLR